MNLIKSYFIDDIQCIVFNGVQSVLGMYEMLRFPSESQTCTQLNVIVL